MVVLAVAAVGVGVVVLKGPQLTATEQLAKAEQAKGNDRTSGLVQLASLPDATDAQLARAGALLTEAKEWDAVLSLVDGWLLKNPKSLDARLLEARAAVQSRKGKRAETAVKEAGVLAPNDARPDAVLAELRELQADSGAALEAWTPRRQEGARQRPVPGAAGLLALAERAARRGRGRAHQGEQEAHRSRHHR